MSQNHWVVSVWVEGATRPVRVWDFRGTTAEADATRHAQHTRDEIKRMGSTHRVQVGPVIHQS
jgi:hypothetical protein